MRAKPLGEYLESGDGISRLMPQAADLLAVRRALASVLAESLPRSVSIANYKQGVVVFIAESGAVAARLRLLEPRIAGILNKCGIEATGIRIVVQPHRRTLSQTAEKKGLFVSPSVSEALWKTAQGLPAGSLKDSVMALAERTRQGGRTDPAHHGKASSEHDRHPLQSEQRKDG